MNENDYDYGIDSEAEAEIPDLNERLENMERDNRRWRFGALLLTIGFLGSAGFTAYHRNSSQTLEVQQLVLRDAQGVKRGELGVDRYGVPRLTLMDDKGRETARLEGTLDQSSQLLMYDRGRLRVDLAATPQGAMLHMMDDRMVPASTIYLNDQGPGLHLRTQQGETHLKTSIPANPLSSPTPGPQNLTSAPDQSASPASASTSTSSSAIAASPAARPRTDSVSDDPSALTPESWNSAIKPIAD